MDIRRARVNSIVFINSRFDAFRKYYDKAQEAKNLYTKYKLLTQAQAELYMARNLRDFLPKEVLCHVWSDHTIADEPMDLDQMSVMVDNYMNWILGELEHRGYSLDTNLEIDSTLPDEANNNDIPAWAIFESHENVKESYDV